MAPEKVNIGVSPARAGMVPPPESARQPARSFPRASGDGPMMLTPPAEAARFPPRERGWSPVSAQIPDVFHVSPARAGMVP